MAASLLILSSGAGEPAWNMAFDDALLRTATQRRLPLLRFYAWTQPAATFGYAQRFAEVERLTLLRPLIRRPTGGGIVPHDRDWTYSLSLPPDHPWHGLAARESYRLMHAWVVAAFARLGLDTEIAPSARRLVPGQCFVGWEESDILWKGRKIGGAAQRRNRLGLLIQGSIQPPPGPRRDLWEEAMRLAAPAGLLPGDAADCHPDETLLILARELVASRYSQPAYNAAR